nr:MAG TPA: hypothetical protein [Caudoviricetes sp.]
MNDTIEHFGVKGMRWGHRNRREYLTNKYMTKGYGIHDAMHKADRRLETERKLKKAALIGGGVALTGLAAYAGYKGVNSYLNRQKQKAMQRGLEEMAKIQAENATKVSGKTGKIKRLKEASKNLKSKFKDARSKELNKLKDAGKNLKSKIKDVHDKDLNKWKKSIEKANAAKNSKSKSPYNPDIDKIYKDFANPGILGHQPSKKKNMGAKLKEISKNFKRINKQANGQVKAISEFDKNALKMLNELQNRKG